MIPKTPEHERNIHKSKKEFDTNWYVDFETKEILRKPMSLMNRIKNFFWKDRFSIFSLYWWCTYRWVEGNAMSFPFPIQADNMPISGFPMKYELQGGWTIPTCDRKYLYKGPLASENLDTVIVPHQLGFQRFLNFLNQIKSIAMIFIPIIGVCIRYWTEILQIYVSF
ncbi:MAG: hypothetical protein ACI9U0_002161 [Flavobacteriales bacterium]|jgi:hypothetical protein